MDFTTKMHTGNLTSAAYPVLVVPAFEDLGMTPALKDLDRQFKGTLAASYKNEALKEEGEVYIAPTPLHKGIRRVAFVGMGKSYEVDLETLRRVAGKSANALRKRDIARVVFLVEPFIPADGSIEDTGRALIEGAWLGAYSFDRFKSEKDTHLLASVELHLPKSAGRVKDYVPMMDEALALTTSTLLTRDWANTPANYATPTHLAQLAKNIGREAGLGVKILGKNECEKLGMGAFLGVSKGSRQEPKFIVLDYKPKNFSKTICFVGKAVTFDSGGISLKPGLNMHIMKADMGGGIAVLAAMRAIGVMVPAGVRVVGIVPACENLPDGDAQKPGDIVRTQSGKSIEILNTDAEGRLILADGLEYGVREYKPSAIIDMATLTGACVIALGERVAGIWTDHDDLAEAMEKASELSGEPVWRMPLVKAYNEYLKSPVADTTNMGKREGGAISAALFLRKFVGDTPWMHVDIAGPMWANEPRPYCPKGATGYGPRLLYNFVKTFAE